MYFCKWFRLGVSSTHGGHQVAQKFSTTTLFFRSARCPGFPAISSGKSCAFLPAMEASPCRYEGMAKNTTTNPARPTTAQAAIFLRIPIECYTNAIKLGRETPLLHPIDNVNRRAEHFLSRRRHPGVFAGFHVRHHPRAERRGGHLSVHSVLGESSG